MNAVLLGGVFGVLIVQTWSPSSARVWIGPIGVSVVLVTYSLMLLLSIRRRRAATQRKR
jgi:hypothetical protein